MKRRLLSFCLSIFVLFSILRISIPETVYADESFDSALSAFLGRPASEDDKYNWSLAITSLQTDGFSVHAIAGIMGNAFVEGGANSIYAIEGYGGKTTTDGVNFKNFESGKSYTYDCKPALTTNKKGKTMGGEGHGICQWSFGRAKGLSDFAKSNSKYGGVTVTHWVKDYDTDFFQGTYSIPNMGGQICWMLEEMHGSYAGTKSAIKDMTNARDAAKSFHDSYEGSKGWSEARADSAELAVPVVEACTGLTGSGGNDGDGSGGDSDAENIAADMIAKGYWSEDQLSAYCKLCEINIQSEYLDSARRENLDQSSLEGLSNWERNVRNNAKEDGFIAKLRIATMWLGIMFTVWVALIYIAYWFDRLNSLFYIDMLSILTFGKLHISDTEDECTFHLNTLGKTDKKTVNHKAILGICLTGLLFASLIITGAFYKIIAGFVNFVLRILS